MHLNPKINRVVIIGFLLLIIASCAKKEEVKYIAKVGDAILTESDISKAASNYSDSSNFREVFIRQWIEEQLLFMAAKERGVLADEEYQSIVKESEKKAANTILIKKILEETEIIADSSAVRNYFNKNSSEFKLTQAAILYNYAVFLDYEKAQIFRKSLFNNNWSDAVAKAIYAKELYESSEGVFTYIVNDAPDVYKEVYNNLYPNQVSEVMITINGRFLIFQLLEKYDKNEIPNLKNIYEMVQQRYIANQRELAYKNYIKKLYSNYSTRIER